MVATGVSENMIPSDGWTLPGVIGAGAVQTMVNLRRALPGKGADGWKWKYWAGCKLLVNAGRD